MESDKDLVGFISPTFPPPSLVSLSSTISPSPRRRLSSHFTPPTRPIRKLAWMSLQGRLVNADEASSAATIGGGLSVEEAVAWELFKPMHRVLIVAVIAVAVIKSEKNKQIYQLQKSVQIRDEVLSSMQQKLDNLCEQVNYFKDQPEIGYYNLKSSSCGCRQCDKHASPLSCSGGDSAMTSPHDIEIIKYETPQKNDVEPEERRLSSLSDWAPSVSSSMDIQWNNSEMDKDINNLRKECEDKDATIKELSTLLHSSDAVGSKRIVELEDTIRRKHMIITRLKKDIMVLEQKVMSLTRLERPSFSPLKSHTRKVPLMRDNIVYDMDSPPSSSSSDSDCPPKPQHQHYIVREDTSKDIVSVSRGNQKQGQAENSKKPVRSTERPPRSRPMNPLKEKSMNQQSSSVPLPRSRLSSPSVSRDLTSKRRTTTNSPKVTVASQRKWT